MNIIIFTNGYPLEGKDVFFDNEISFLQERFDEIFIVPILEDGLMPKTSFSYDEVHKGCRVISYDYKKTNLFFKPRNMGDILKSDKQKGLKVLYKKVQHILYSNLLIKILGQIEKEYQLNKKETLLYSYWFHYHALGIARAEGYKMKISRAHRYDLYQEWRIQPFKAYTLSQIDYVFPCSKMGENYLKKMYPGFDNIRTSYLGTYQKGENPKHTSHRLNLLSCSFVHPVKRLEKIVDALSLIDDIEVRWTHIGGGIDFESLKAYAQVLDGKDKILYQLLGNMTNDQVLNYYTSHPVDLFINTSQSEGLPVSIMEACSYGIPIIATDVGGVSEIVDPGKNGYLLDENFKDEVLKDFIEDYYKLDQLNKEKMGRASYKKWADHFNAEDNYNEFYNFIIKNVLSD
ncbi:glycosyltransferase [Acidaminobacter sp. JC074]|uniref:glycosyltransferase n=1 Tax=Acidaminobacter sp. JC074 TaxID=2530199 RepID=UPI001F105DE2|nr:glycosyltransferase [Acidaminobacter sp. JC074]MCH4889718.1 glycosyltransferase [Acidaminobacter sp. JC074]